MHSAAMPTRQRPRARKSLILSNTLCSRTNILIRLTPLKFGAAWKKTSRENRDYLSVKLDDPSFPAPIYASLVDAEDGYSLIWSRSRSAD